MEVRLIGSRSTLSFLVVIEVEERVVALAECQDAAGGERLPSFLYTDIEFAFGYDGHGVGIEFGPLHAGLVARGSHDDEGAVVDPTVGILAGDVGIAHELLLLYHLHLVVDELELGESVGRHGHLVIVFTLHDGLHAVVGIDFGSFVAEVDHRSAVECGHRLHDGGDVAAHTALPSHRHGEVEVIGSLLLYGHYGVWVGVHGVVVIVFTGGEGSGHDKGHHHHPEEIEFFHFLFLFCVMINLC